MSADYSSSLEILIVDDEPAVRETLALCFTDEEHTTHAAANSTEALQVLEREIIDLAFVDLRLSDESGLDLISPLLEKAPWLKIVLMTAHASVETAVDAMRRGASDYLTKPLDPQVVRILAARQEAVRRLEKKIEKLEEDISRSSPEPLLESRNPAMKRLVEMARRVATSEASVLIRGESGTGKGVLAREIHAASRRADGPFSVINCPSLSAELLQSELFGHVKGAFTGAVKTQPGKIDLTSGGTLFMDEIGDLPAQIQPKLLRFIQDREYERVGDPKPRRADVRILSATNRDLEEMVEENEFREDLLYRLNVVEITVPPLRERPQDVEDLSESFLRFFAARHGRRVSGFTSAAQRFVVTYSWPGNVRELQNAIERAVILCESDHIGPELLGGSTAELAAAASRERSADLNDEASGAEDQTKRSLAEIEKSHIQSVVSSSDSLKEAADTLGISPTTLRRKREEYGLD